MSPQLILLQKSLAVTLKQILDELPYGPAPDYRIAVNAQFRSSLAEAIHLYTNARGVALEILYNEKDFNKRRPMELEADFEEVAASCGHFSFSLLDFANELNAYLDILDELKVEIDERPSGRTWEWLRIWQRAHGPELKPDPGNLSQLCQESKISAY